MKATTPFRMAIVLVAVALFDVANHSVNAATVEHTVLLTMNSTKYCAGNSWSLKLSNAAPNAAIRLAGTVNGAPWEIPQWADTDAGGSFASTGTFAMDSAAKYTLHVEVAGSTSDILPVEIVNCGWRDTTSMSTAHAEHRAILLTNGKVLVIGGSFSDDPGSAELYDPATETWSVTGRLNTARKDYTATLLSDGKVLVAGGNPPGLLFLYSPLNSVELYDPATGIWSPASSLNVARHFHTATLLPNSKVLVAGGFAADVGERDELYDPGAGTWSFTGSLLQTYPALGRTWFQTATALSNGKVLVVGNTDPTSDYDGTYELWPGAALYDPLSETWRNAGLYQGSGDAFTPSRHTATLLPSGKVFVAEETGANVQAQLYDPQTNAWTPAGFFNTPLNSHTATLLPNGKVLLVGVNRTGSPLSTTNRAVLYDTDTGTWSDAVPPNTARRSHTATLLPSGKVLVAGGYTNSAELYDGGFEVPLLALESTRCLGASWNVTVIHPARGASVRLTGVSNGASWEIAQWGNIGAGGNFKASGTWANGTEGTHTLRVQIEGIWSNAVSFVVSDCKPPTVTLELPAIDRGRVRLDGDIGGGGPSNYGAGRSETLLHRSFFVFRVPLLEGRIITAATLKAFNPSYSSPDPTETYTLFDLDASSVKELLSNADPVSRRIYDDAGSGQTYGQRIVSSADNGRVVEIALNAEGLTALNGSRGFEFALGGSLTTQREGNLEELVFSMSGETELAMADPVRLSLTTKPLAIAPDARFAIPDHGGVSLQSSGRMELAVAGYAGIPVSGSATLSGLAIVGLTRLAPLAVAQRPGAFAATGDMDRPRSGHTATLLPDGRVLIAGGDENLSADNECRTEITTQFSAELYDPAAGTFGPTGEMSRSRSGHTATLLPGGKVLIAGGDKENFSMYAECEGTLLPPLTRTELYDPATGLFSITGNMSQVRTGHTATLLRNGRVLIAGSGSAELYDPSTGTFTITGKMIAERYGHTATLLNDGRVLITGGAHLIGTFGSSSSAELYDPSTGSFAATGNMTTSRAQHTGTLLPSGNVLIGGGRNSSGTIVGSAEIFNPSTGAFTATGDMAQPRVGHSAALLHDETVLIAGGSKHGAADSEIYDAAAGSFSAASNMTTQRSFFTTTMLPGGGVLAVGGYAGTYTTKRAELYEPTLPPQPARTPQPATRDFNGDGRSDVLFRDPAGDVSTWLTNGTTTTLIASIWPGWSIVGSGDFNGDAKADILWRDSSGMVAIWLMDGAAIAGYSTLGNIWPGWSIAGSGDFNGDGKTDILWRDISGTVAIWLMDGTAVASVSTLGNISSEWSIAGVGDFNADRKADILWIKTQGNVAIWLMNGYTLRNNTVKGRIPNDWEIARTGDYNGDGMADILWRDINGFTAIWWMDGTTTSSYSSIGNISDRRAQ